MRRLNVWKGGAGVLTGALVVWGWPLLRLLLTFWSVDGQEPDADRLLRAAPEALIRPAQVPPLAPGGAVRVLARASQRTVGTAGNAYERHLSRTGWVLVDRVGSASRWRHTGSAVVTNRVGDKLTLACKRFSRWFDICAVQVTPFDSR